MCGGDPVARRPRSRVPGRRRRRPAHRTQTRRPGRCGGPSAQRPIAAAAEQSVAIGTDGERRHRSRVPGEALRFRPAGTSQTRIVLSSEPEKSHLPSVERAGSPHGRRGWSAEAAHNSWPVATSRKPDRDAGGHDELFTGRIEGERPAPRAAKTEQDARLLRVAQVPEPDGAILPPSTRPDGRRSSASPRGRRRYGRRGRAARTAPAPSAPATW